MAKRPEDRFATAGELGRAALAARYDVALLRRARRRGRRRRSSPPGCARRSCCRWSPSPASAQAAEGIRASGACAVLVGRERPRRLGPRGPRRGTRRSPPATARSAWCSCCCRAAPDPGDPSLAYLADHPWVDLRAGAGRRAWPRPTSSAPCAAPTSRPGLAPHDGRRVALPRPRGLPRGGRRPLLRPRAGRRPPARAPAHGALRRRARALGQRQELAGAGRAAAGAPPRRAPGSGELARAGDPPRRAPARRARRAARPPAGRGRPVAPPTSPPTSAPSTWPSPAPSRAGPPDERVLVVVDQLEEVFTLCQDEGERAAFLGNLVYAATIPGGRTVVVATMRADFYHRLAEHPDAARAGRRRTRSSLGPARRARPAPGHRGAGAPLRPRARARPDAPHPHRRRRPPGHPAPARAPAATSSGGAAAAARSPSRPTPRPAASRARSPAAPTRSTAAMDPERQAIARRVLLRLTQPGEGTEDTRRRADPRASWSPAPGRRPRSTPWSTRSPRPAS